MKKLFAFLFVLMFSLIVMGQQVNGYGILTYTLTAALPTSSSSFVPIGTFNNVALAVEADSAVVVAITIYDGSTSNHTATVAAATGDTLTVAAGAFGSILLKGYNSAGTYVNRINGANYVKVAFVRQTGTSSTSAKTTARLILKN